MRNSGAVAGSAADPADQEGSKSLADRHRHHVVPEGDFPPVLAGAAHAQHLLGGHQEHVAGSEQGGEDEQVDRRVWPQPERDGGCKHQYAADPGSLRVVAAIDVAADAQRREDRNDGKARRDDAEPQWWEAELDGPIRNADTHDQHRHVGHDYVRQKWRQQRPVHVPAAGKAELFGH